LEVLKLLRPSRSSFFYGITLERGFNLWEWIFPGPDKRGIWGRLADPKRKLGSLSDEESSDELMIAGKSE
jgi:hypothetical protein